MCARNRDSELIANAEEEQRADHDQRLQLKQELAEARTRESDLKGSICELENELPSGEVTAK